MVDTVGQVLVFHVHPVSGDDMISALSGVAEVVDRHSDRRSVRDIASSNDRVVSDRYVVAASQVDSNVAWIDKPVVFHNDVLGGATPFVAITKDDASS